MNEFLILLKGAAAVIVSIAAFYAATFGGPVLASVAVMRYVLPDGVLTRTVSRVVGTLTAVSYLTSFIGVCLAMMYYLDEAYALVAVSIVSGVAAYLVVRVAKRKSNEDEGSPNDASH